MATIIKWNEGEGNIAATYDGSGNAPILFSSDVANEGIDREQVVSVSTTDDAKSVDVVVRQAGLREVFMASDGEFILADGGTFNVIKGGVSLLTNDYMLSNQTKLRN